MRLSDENRDTLFVSVHKSIEESANTDANHIFHGRVDQLINYPSNGGLTADEQSALQELKGNEVLRSALRKVLASTAAGVFFDFFCVLDGVADPDPWAREWSGVRLRDLPSDDNEDAPLLHDEFYATYWDWKEKRKNTNWSLDLLDPS